LPNNDLHFVSCGVEVELYARACTRGPNIDVCLSVIIGLVIEEETTTTSSRNIHIHKTSNMVTQGTLSKRLG